MIQHHIHLESEALKTKNIVKVMIEFNLPTTDDHVQTVGAFVKEAEMGDGLILNHDFSQCPTYLFIGAWIDAPGHVSLSFIDLGKPHHPINLPILITLIKGKHDQ